MVLRPYKISNSVFPVSNGVYPASLSISWSTIDNFNDESLSEWNGDTASWSHSSSVAYEGSSTYQNNSSSGSDCIRRPASDVTTTQGEVYRFYTRIAANSVPDGNTFFTIGNQETGNANNLYGDWTCYAAKTSYENGNFEILLYDATGGGTSLASDSTTPPTDEWIYWDFEWTTSDELIGTVYDSTDTQIASMSTTDTTITSDGGIGLATDDDSEGVNQFFDYLQRGT